QRDAAVDHVDGVNLDRPRRPGAFLLARLAFDERAEIPAAVRHLAPDDDRVREAHAMDDDARLHELADAVFERDLVDVYERLPAARQVDVAEPDAAEQRSLQPSDVQRRREVLVRLPDDETAEPVLGPPGLDDGERD